MRPPKRGTAPPKSVPHGFNRQGSWVEEIGIHHETDAAVRAMLRHRRESGATPSEMASMIRTLAYNSAFPLVLSGHWDTARDPFKWSTVATSTSAEEVIKRGGNGAGGYWSSSRWELGENPGPWPRMTPAQRDEFAQMVAGKRPAQPADRYAAMNDLAVAMAHQLGYAVSERWLTGKGSRWLTPQQARDALDAPPVE